MSTFESKNKTVWRRWQTLTGTFLIVGFGACTASSDKPADTAEDYSTETDESGAISAIAKTHPAGTLLPEGSVGDSESDKAGCVHIRWCNAPGPDEVVCDTNDRPCSRAARFNECIADADYGCGNWHNMRFDPPI